MRNITKIFTAIIMIMIATLTLTSCGEIEKAEIEEPKSVEEINIVEVEETEIELEIEEEIIEEAEFEEVEIIVVEEVKPIILIKSTEVMNEIKDRLMRRMEGLTAPYIRSIETSNTSSNTSDTGNNSTQNNNENSENNNPPTTGENDNPVGDSGYITVNCRDWDGTIGVVNTLVRCHGNDETCNPSCSNWRPPTPLCPTCGVHHYPVCPPHICHFPVQTPVCHECENCTNGNWENCTNRGHIVLPCSTCGTSPP